MKSLEARKKFDGQPFSARMYAEMLRASGVDQVVTVHNHKPEVLASIYREVYADSGEQPPFVNLDVAHLIANLILRPVVFERDREAAAHASVVLAHGRIERAQDVVHLLVTRIESLDAILGRLAVSSRDFR